MNQGAEIEVRRLRTELAFLLGDRAHGGPARTEEVADLRARIAALLEAAKEDAKV